MKNPRQVWAQRGEEEKRCAVSWFVCLVCLQLRHEHITKVQLWQANDSACNGSKQLRRHNVRLNLLCHWRRAVLYDPMLRLDHWTFAGYLRAHARRQPQKDMALPFVHGVY